MKNSSGSRVERWFYVLLFAITFASLGIRVFPLYNRVITPDAVRFQSIDPYYHVRLSKYVTEHYPHRLEFDSLRLHPGGQRVDVYPAFDLFNATLAKVAGFGSPSERTTEEAIAWSPPILGAATVVFIGFAARVLAGPWGGLAGAFVAGFLPGGTLPQSIIGMSDHHAFETFLLSAAWWILTLLLQNDGSTRKRLLLSAAVGATAGAYSLTWEGSPILPTVVGLCVTAQVLMHAVDQEKLRRIAMEAALMTGTAAVVAWSPQFWSPMITVSMTLLFICALLPLAMLLVRKGIGTGSVVRLRTFWLLTIGVVSAVVALLLPSDLTSSLMTNLSRFDPSEKARTVNELRPLYGDSALLWDSFGLSIAWGAVGIIGALVLLRRRSFAPLLVPLVTGFLFIPSSLLQIRFASAASLAIALLSAVVVGEALQRADDGGRRRKKIETLIRGAIVAAWFITVPAWSAWNAPDVARDDRGPTTDWTSVTRWLKDETSERDTVSTAGGNVVVRRTGVLNWWDSGYYITTIAGRVPVSNPSQAGARLAADAYLDTTGERGVSGLAQEAIRYVIVDAALALHPTSQTGIGGQFPALVIWAGAEWDSYVRTVYFPSANGSLEPRYAYLPSYYRSLLIRLMLFDGKESISTSRAAWAIQVESRIVPSGRKLDVVISSRSFASVADAQSFIRLEGDTTWLLVGFSPFEPCVQLEPVRNIRLVHSSPTIAFSVPTIPKPIPVLKVFEMVQ